MTRLFLLLLLIGFSSVSTSDVGIFATVEVTDRKTVEKWDVITLTNPLTDAVHVVIITKTDNGSSYFYQHYECSAHWFALSTFRTVFYNRVPPIAAADATIPVTVRVDKNSTINLIGYVNSDSNIVEITNNPGHQGNASSFNTPMIILGNQMKAGNSIIVSAGRVIAEFSLHGFTKADAIADKQCEAYNSAFKQLH